MTDNALTPYEKLSKYKNRILSTWRTELERDQTFSSKSTNPLLDTTTEQLVNQLTQTIENTPLPNFDKHAFQPIFKLWHAILKDQSQQGVSIKDTAMLMYSLKHTLLKLHEESDEFTQDDLNQISNLLDILGVLTFEIFTAEQNRLLTHSKDQLHYLQMEQTKYFDHLIGASPAMQSVYKAIGLVLENDVTILLQGESGTGKDVIANAIHRNSNRKEAPFIALNCGAIPKELIESELFGHEKGAFTGATDRRLGKFELADNGTLFLDEIGELPFDMQVKFLRVLQNQEIERIGSHTKNKINVRIIAATNKNLKDLVDEGKFRLDLYYRLNIFPINIPPLRQRKEDIAPLAYHFLKRAQEKFKTIPTELSTDAIHYLESNPWEGNIRELENTLYRASLICKSNIITADILALHPGDYFPITPTPKQLTIAASDIIPLSELEKHAIEHALKLKNGNIQQTAKALGISRTTLYNKAKAYNIAGF